MDTEIVISFKNEYDYIEKLYLTMERYVYKELLRTRPELFNENENIEVSTKQEALSILYNVKALYVSDLDRALNKLKDIPDSSQISLLLTMF